MNTGAVLNPSGSLTGTPRSPRGAGAESGLVGGCGSDAATMPTTPLRSPGSVIATNSQSWLLNPEGAYRAASTTFSMSTSGTGSDRKCQELRLVLMTRMRLS